MIGYINTELDKHRATREALLKEGKTYRSQSVARENGYLAALEDIKFVLELPERNAKIRESMNKFGEILKG